MAKSRTFNTVKQIEAMPFLGPGQVAVPWWDKSTPGLYVKPGARTKNFYYRKRFGTGQLNPCIGQFSADAPDDDVYPPKWGKDVLLPLKGARRVAAYFQDMIAKGKDPRAVQADAAAEQKRAAGYTYERAVEDFYSEFLTDNKQNVTRRDQKARLLRIGRDVKTGESKWLNRPVADITLADVREDLKDCMAKGWRVEANHRHAVLSVFFKWLAVEQLAPENIMRNVRRPATYTPEKMPAWNSAEAAALWQCADRLDEHTGAYLRLLMLLGQRPNEVGGMRWDELNLDADSTEEWPDSGESLTNTWTLPPDRHKAGHHSRRTKVFGLPAEAVRILKELDREKGNPFVFPGRGTRGGSPRPATVGSKLQARIQKLSGVERFTFQNARRTLRTGLSRLAIPPHVKDACLNHAPRSTGDKHYDSYQYVAEQREAFEAWHRAIEKNLAEPKQSTRTAAEQEARV